MLTSPVRNKMNDIHEGWLALCVCIIKQVDPGTAFKMLEGQRLQPREWCKNDIKNIDDLRKAGWSWEQIGKEYGLPRSTVIRTYNRVKEKYHIEMSEEEDAEQ